MNEDRIRELDDRLSRDGVPIRRRPWVVWLEWLRNNGPARLDKPEERAIFDWYARNYPEGTFALGALFTGAMYFDESVWPVHVPICFGRVSIGVDDMVETMPPIVRERLYRHQTAVYDLTALCVDCLDYGIGLRNVRQNPPANPFAKRLLFSGDKELRASVELLLSRYHTQKVAEAARMATEMFLKCFLAHKDALDEHQARRINHDLDHALGRCLGHAGAAELRVLTGRLAVFPAVSDRYNASDRPLQELWTAYTVAQVAGSAIVRAITGRRACQELLASETKERQPPSGPWG